MYRTIIAGWNARERGRGAVSLVHVISVATGALHGAPCAVAPDRHTSRPVLDVPRRADAEHADALLAGLAVTAR